MRLKYLINNLFQSQRYKNHCKRHLLTQKFNRTQNLKLSRNNNKIQSLYQHRPHSFPLLNPNNCRRNNPNLLPLNHNAKFLSRKRIHKEKVLSRKWRQKANLLSRKWRQKANLLSKKWRYKAKFLKKKRMICNPMKNKKLKTKQILQKFKKKRQSPKILNLKFYLNQLLDLNLTQAQFLMSTSTL